MTLEFGQTDELVNTQYAPLAALLAHYQQNQVFDPLQQVVVPMKSCDFTPADKLHFGWLRDVIRSESEAKPELHLATIGGWSRFADQSGLSRTLDALTLMKIEQLRQAETQIWQLHSQIQRHDWRSYLWLYFDLSGLPCSKRAEASQKGYFSGKKSFWPPISASQCCEIPRNYLVGTVSGQSAHH